MATLTFPITKAPNMATWALRPNTQNMRSELNGVVQTLALPGDIWTGTLTFTNRIEAEANSLMAFLASLRGRAGRFYLVPPGYHAPYNTAQKTLWTSGGVIAASVAAYTGDTIVTVSDSVVGGGSNPFYWLQPGDYIQIGTELKMVTATVPNHVTSTCEIAFAPPLRSGVAIAAPVVVNDPKCICMLADDNQSQWQQQPGRIYAMSIAVEEALDV